MLHTLSLKPEQVYGDMYNSWLRDTLDKSSNDSKQIFRDMVESGFLDRQVILRRRRLGVNVITSLSSALHRTPLAKLDLYGNALRDTGCEVVSHLMANLPNLTYLDLGANGITGVGARSLGFAVAEHPKLMVLLLASRRGVDPYVNDIRASSPGAVVLLQGCLRSRSLRQLDLSGNRLGGESSISRAGASNNGREGGQRVHGNDARSGGDVGAGGDGVHGGGGGGGLFDADDEDEEGDETGADGSVPQRQQQPSPVELIRLILARPTASLTSLRLSDAGLKSADAIPLIAALQMNSSLTTLDLSENHLPASVGDALGRLLLDRSAAQSSCVLTNIRLSGNPIVRSEAVAATTTGAAHGVLFRAADARAPTASGGGATSTAGRRLFAALSAITTAAGAPSAPQLPSLLFLFALASDRLLTTLELNRCGIGPEAMRILCRSLSTNTCLICLSLKENKVDSDSAVELGRALCRHPCLRKLYLCGNDIGDEGACALASVMEGERGLDMLYASYNSRQEQQRHMQGMHGAGGAGSTTVVDASFTSPFDMSVSHQEGAAQSGSGGGDVAPDRTGSADAANAGRCVSFAPGIAAAAAMKRIAVTTGAQGRSRSLASGGGGGNGGSRRGTTLNGGGNGHANDSGSTLEVLDLRHTSLGDRGLVALGVALQGTSSLHVLLLGGNHFSSKGGETFTALLEKNKSVVMCDLGATSVPCPTLLRLERCVARNRERLEHAESDTLKRELIRLHFQQYKLDEAKIELEALRERSANTRTAADNFDLQFKQDQSDYSKKLRELEEQSENYLSQARRYEQQTQQIEQDLTKTQAIFEEDTVVARERLEAEVKIREKVEEEYKQVEAELEDWKSNPQGREQARRDKLVEVRQEMEQWATQRKQYQQDIEKLQQEVRELEAKYAAVGGGAKAKKKMSVSKKKRSTA